MFWCVWSEPGCPPGPCMVEDIPLSSPLTKRPPERDASFLRVVISLWASLFFFQKMKLTCQFWCPRDNGYIQGRVCECVGRRGILLGRHATTYSGPHSKWWGVIKNLKRSIIRLLTISLSLSLSPPSPPVGPSMVQRLDSSTVRTYSC